MPKFYCDYCDAFLTHDSLKGRKAHNDGRKHKDRVRAYYQKWLEDRAQQMVDETVRAFSTERMYGAVPRTTMMPMQAPGMIRPLMSSGPYQGPQFYPSMVPPVMPTRAPAQKFHPYK